MAENLSHGTMVRDRRRSWIPTTQVQLFQQLEWIELAVRVVGTGVAIAMGERGWGTEMNLDTPRWSGAGAIPSHSAQRADHDLPPPSTRGRTQAAPPLFFASSLDDAISRGTPRT